MELLLTISVIIIWISSIYMLLKWDKFNSFFIANGILLIIYTGILIYFKSIWGQDGYGLGLLFRIIKCLMIHVLIVFVFAIIKNRQLKK